MPLLSYKFAPGFDKQSTPYGAENKWIDGENIRFRYGQPEKIGGWVKLVANKLYGAVRAQFAWSALDGTRFLALGTDKKLYIYTEGAIHDITPVRATDDDLTNPFVTTSGSPIVTVTDAGHGASAGDFVTFSNADAVGGLDMNAEFEITSVTSSSVYTVTHSSNASSGATGGGSSTVDVEYQLSVGQEVNTYGYGWGIDPWNGLRDTGRITDQLNEALDATETGVDVDDGSKFANGDYILVDQEIMKVTGVSSNTLTVTRDLTTNEGTTTVSAGSHNATTHADNTTVTIIFDASDTSINATSWNEAASSSTTVLDSRYWVFENFGEDLLALQSNGKLFKWDKSSGVTTRAAVVHANAPTASRHLILSTPDRHVILMGTETTIGSTTSQDDLFLRFSSQEDTSTWSPASTNTAGSFRIQDGSKIITTLRSRGGILIWTDTSLHQLQFIGPPFTFGVNLVTQSVSMVSPQAAINANNAIYFMDEDNFYIYEGGVQSLPCTVRAYVFDDFNYSQVYKVFAAKNAKFNEVTWFYCSSSSTEIDRYVTYNYLDKVWHIGNMDRTAWMDIGSSTDAPLAAGTNNYLYDHETGSNADGSAMTAFVESADFDAGDGNQFMFINRIIPDVLFYGSSTDPTVTYSIKTRNYPLGTLTTATTASVGSSTGVSNVRARARQMRVRVESTDEDNLWRLGDTRFDIRQDGRR